MADRPRKPSEGALAAIPEAHGGVVSRASSRPPPARPKGAGTLPKLGAPGVPGDASMEVEAKLGRLALGPGATGPGGPAGLPAICLFGRYEILGRLAFGGMAEIFLARESSSVGASRHIVIKRVLPNVADDEKFIEMFLNEARLAIQLNHPDICHIYEFGELEGSYFIAMDWVNGVPLGKLIRRARKAMDGLPIEVAVRIAAQIAGALDYAHRAKDALGRPMNIVHRDVTPHNVMIAYDGQVKLLDFGIAKAETQSSQTEAGTVKGKFSYMSPEQCTGKPIDGRSDVFALGICLWEALVGRALYRRETQYETMHAVIHEPVPDPRQYRRGLPQSLVPIVTKALEKDRDARYANAAEMRSALEHWLAENRMVVNSTTLATLMEELYAEEIQRGPLVDSNPFGASFQSLPRPSRAPDPKRPSGNTGSMSAAHPLSNPSAVVTPAPVEKSKPRVLPLVLLTLASFAIAMGGVGYYLSLGDGAAAGNVDTAATNGDEPTELALHGAEPAELALDDDEPRGAVDEARTDAAGETVEVPALTHATVEVTFSPGNATVTLDGQAVRGESPLLIDAIAPGSHRIEVSAPGHQSFVTDLELVAGERADIMGTLTALPRTPAAPPGRLSINTRPWSKVYVGPRLLGTTPIAEARVTSGAVRLRLVDRDGRTHRRLVRVPAGGAERVFYDLN